MILRFLFVSIATLSLCISGKAQSINTENSIVSFSVRNMGLNTVKGNFKGMNGQINFDPNNLDASIFDVYIDANTIDTGSAKRDQHLKNEDFFEVEKYPSICFKSTKITKTKSAYSTKGLLSMHGVSKNVEILFTYNDGELVGHFKVNRFDYNIGTGTGKFLVGKEVDLKIVTILN